MITRPVQRHGDADPGGEPSARSTEAVPYRDAQELLADLLPALRRRIQLVRDHDTSAAHELDWPADLLDAESRVERRLRESARVGSAITLASARLGLSRTEERVLWTLIAHELCPVARGLLREINTEQVPDPTTDTLRRVVYGPAPGMLSSWVELASGGVLRKLGLVERTDGTSVAPLHRQTWKAADRVVALVHGHVGLDPTLAGIAELRAPGRARAELAVAPEAVGRLAAACARPGLVIVFGRAASGRRSLLEALLHEGDRRVVQIEGRAIAKDRDAAARELYTIARECALLDLVPLIRDIEAVGPNGEIPDRIDLVENALEGLVVATASRPIARAWRSPVTHVELGPLSGAQRAAVWHAALPTSTLEQADEIATLYPLSPGLIHAAGLAVCADCAGRPPTGEQIAAALRSILDDRLAGLATRVSVKQTWDDMVLPEDQLAAIVELMARARDRRTVYERWGAAERLGSGLGLAALFSGPPGTGKTMAAGLVARDLGVEIYKVDISRIVSKWIGETEKNLAQLFDAAEAGHAILLFDEADSLFGKRTEVRSSNDRYANQEVNFLLQRLESYDGIVILTTNHETAIDEAFQRRLSSRVRFPMPSAGERLALWKVLMPPRAPTKGDLRLQRLAEGFEMSGGHIRNAVLRAAFLAVAEDVPIEAAHLLRAAQLEYEAMGKIATVL